MKSAIKWILQPTFGYQAQANTSAHLRAQTQSQTHARALAKTQNKPQTLTLFFATLALCVSLQIMKAAEGDPNMDRDMLADRGARYDDGGLPPPSQNPALSQNLADTLGAGDMPPNFGAPNQAPDDIRGSDLLPHQYPMSDRLTSPDIPTAQLKAAIDATKKGDLITAFGLFKSSCEGGNPSGCFGLGTMYASGRGVELNMQKAQQYYEMGCSAGDPTSCTNLAMIYNEKSGASKDDKELAVQFYMTACQAGDAIACNNLGFMYANGDGVNKDFFTAIRYYKLACNGGSNLGCYNLGLLSNTQNIYGKNKSSLSKADLNYAACNAGDIKGCSNLGWMYANGLEGAPLSYAYAAKYFKIACDSADVKSCSNLGVLYQKGLGVTQDTKYALDLYAYACNSGLQQGCDNYRILKQDLQINPNPTYTTKPQPSRKPSFYNR